MDETSQLEMRLKEAHAAGVRARNISILFGGIWLASVGITLWYLSDVTRRYEETGATVDSLVVRLTTLADSLTKLDQALGDLRAGAGRRSLEVDSTLATLRRELLTSTEPDPETVRAVVAAYTQDARGHLARREYKDAVSKLRLALELAPSDQAINSLLGETLARQDEWDAAVGPLGIALSGAPSDYRPDLLNTRAYVFLQLGRYASGLSDLEEAERLRPGRIAVTYNRAFAHAQLGESDVAATLLRPLVQVESPQAEDLALMGFIEFRLGHDMEAQAYFTRAIEADPDYGGTYYYRGLMRAGSDGPGADADLARSAELGFRPPRPPSN